MLRLWIKSKIKSYPQARRTARVEKYNIQILGNTYIPVDKFLIHRNLAGCTVAFIQHYFWCGLLRTRLESPPRDVVAGGSGLH